ncbi:hypothetical protein [Spiroplasma endosymbiont of Dilophus febrilis]|uniref:hypothetical protein n=1 Tax=Spiroplasma endosymbiont of Dilophus febrilis TaxID=3066292 RepID=UPI00313BF592
MSKFLFYKPLLVIASLFISTNGTKFLFANKLTGNNDLVAVTSNSLKSQPKAGILNNNFCGYQYKYGEHINDVDYFFLRYPKSSFNKIERKGKSTWNFDYKVEGKVQTSFLWVEKYYITDYFVDNCDALVLSSLISDHYSLKDIVIPFKHYNQLLEHNGYLNPKFPNEALQLDFKEESNNILKIIEQIASPVIGYIPVVGNIISKVSEVVDAITGVLNVWDNNWIYTANNISFTKRLLTAIQFTLSGNLNFYYNLDSKTPRRTISANAFKEFTNNFTEGLVLRHSIKIDNWDKKILSEKVVVYNNNDLNSVKLEIDTYKLSEERYVRVTLVDYYETTCKMHRWHCVSDNDPGCCMSWETIPIYKYVTWDKWDWSFKLWNI